MPVSFPKTIDTAFTGDSGSGGVIGLVPAPSSGDAAANKYLKASGAWATVSASAPAGILPFNYLVNPGFRHWARNTIDPTAALTTADGGYGTTCWYTLANNTTVTQQRVAGTTAPYALKLNTPSGSVDMWGCAQIVANDLTYSLRGKTVIFQVRVKRSEAKKIRIALLEWTGTADAPTKDVVNNWSSTTYTTGNFFISSNVTVIGTASTGTMSADTYNLVSVSGTVSSSANNLYVVIWSENALSGTQSLTLECPGLFEGSSTQTWAEGPQSELTNPLRYAYGLHNGLAKHRYGYKNGTQYLEGFILAHPVPMRSAPTLTHNISGWNGAAPTTTLVAAAYYSGGSAAYVTITGALTTTVGNTTAIESEIYFGAGTSFSGTSGNLVSLILGPTVLITNSAEIGV